MRNSFTFAAAAAAAIGAGSLLYAQQGGGMMDGNMPMMQDKQGDTGMMMGGMKMSPEMMTRHRLLMQTRIDAQDPAALLALQQELGLSDDQVQQLEREVEQSQQAAMEILTAEQRQKVQALPEQPQSMMQMHQHMMGQMGGEGMQGMCPMCHMMGGMGTDSASNGDAVQQVDVDAEAQAQIDQLVENYLSISKQLTQDNAQGVAAQFDEVQQAAQGLAQNAPELLQAAVQAVAQAAEARPQTVEEAREALKPLSAAIVKLTKAAPPSDAAAESLHVAYCPMAQASWLQTSQQIANPYMGQKMPECGSIKATIKASEQTNSDEGAPRQ